MNTLIVPCAGKSSRFPNMKPKWMLTHPEGMIMLQKNLSAFDLSSFDRIIITILKEHDEKYNAALFLKQAFPSSVFEILILETLTNGPAETVYETLARSRVEGAFVVRDSDSYTEFIVPKEKNFLVGKGLTPAFQIDRIADKSFIVLKDNHQVEAIVEKQIVSDVIGLGVYGFSSHERYMKSFELLRETQRSHEIYVSHVMSFIMKETSFTYVEANVYEDWGTLEAWLKVMKKYTTYFFDLDGVLFHNTGKYGTKNWDNTFNPMPENIIYLKELLKSGSQLILTTSRPEKYRLQIENYFLENDLKIHAMVMGLNHSPRVIVNDFAPTNPYPSCSAVNIPRNGKLDEYL